MTAIDISALTLAAVAKTVESGALQAAIDEGVKKTVDRIVATATDRYSEFGQAVEAAVKNALKLDDAAVGLPSYNQFILSVIKARFDAIVNGELRAGLESGLDELLRDAPKEIRLSALIDGFKRWVVESGLSTSDRCTIELEATTYGSRWLKLDPKGRCDRYAARFAFLIGQDGKVHALSDGGQDMRNALLFRGYTGFPRDLFRLMAAGSVIVIDQTSFDDSLVRDDDAED